jgi:hypothetical protein
MPLFGYGRPGLLLYKREKCKAVAAHFKAGRAIFQWIAVRTDFGSCLSISISDISIFRDNRDQRHFRFHGQ